MKKILLPYLLFSFVAYASRAQGSITGPECVVSGTEYLYVIVADTVSNSDFQVCITGGAIPGTNTTCASGSYSASFRVIWNPNISSGEIVLTSSMGKLTKTVTITKPLEGGVLDISMHTQVLGYNLVPGNFYCSPASGGGCSTKYSYQWQQSSDKVIWTDIKGANDLLLVLSNPLVQSSFFRRKVVETISNNIAYSNVVTVYVAAPPESK